jgi:hypothetical protein
MVAMENASTIRCIAISSPQLLQRCVTRCCLQTVFYCCAIARFVVRELCLGASLSRKRSYMRPPISRLSSSTSQYCQAVPKLITSLHSKRYRPSSILIHRQNLRAPFRKQRTGRREAQSHVPGLRSKNTRCINHITSL